jgi:hypothetical protein
MLSQSSLTQRAGGSAFDAAEDDNESGQRRALPPSSRRRGGGFTQLSQLSQLQLGGLLAEEEAGGEGGGQRAISQDLAGFEDEAVAEAGDGAFGDQGASGVGFFGAGWEGLRRLQGLNRELCMPAFMAALQFLLDPPPPPAEKAKQGGTAAASSSSSRPAQSAQGQTKKPEWLTLLESALADRGLHPNARLFLLQAFLNEPTASLLGIWAGAPGSALGAGVLHAVCDLLLLPPSSGWGRGGLGGCHYLLCDVADTFITAWAGYRPTAGGAWLFLAWMCVCVCVCLVGLGLCLAIWIHARASLSTHH